MRALHIGNVIFAWGALAALSAGLFSPAYADLVIGKGPTSNVACAKNYCKDTAPNAVLSVKDLERRLSTADVTVYATQKAMNIDVNGSFSWASSHSLTIIATCTLTVNAPVAVDGTGGLTIRTNNLCGNNNNGIGFVFGQKGNVTFLSLTTPLTFNNLKYTLVSNLAMLASDIASNQNGFFALANSYDASADGVYPASPISTMFTGFFEGLGNPISNLSMAGPKSVGLFAFMYNGSLYDVVLANVHIQANGAASVGGLVGSTTGGTAIFNSSVTGII
jgi:hypothetical protein